MCAEAGLPAPDPLIKRCAILAACRLISVPENHILYPLMPWRRQAAYNMCRGSNYAPRWTKSIAPPRLKYLQLDGVLNHILPLTSKSSIHLPTTGTPHNRTEGPPPPHTLRNGLPLSDLGMAGSHNTSTESADTMADVHGAAHPLRTVNICS
ncbi:hypothetical protein PCASD_24240 [Puccinia coronata f. sp. avenae]|uniref:Uncharacterized protein n=1 Tax=Puccinia coronata f. sp. avenae TaxID=200324 RepID=A0A2N5TI01_9BASI|nr:hypothetical protein PCASD_24240 [Puccinia coronata f. sp. avenae]